MFGLNFKGIKSVYGPTSLERVGIDLSGNNLKLAHIRISANKSEIANLVSQNITGLSDDDISRVISSSFSEIKANPAAIMNVVSSNISITKNIEIPSIDPQEIREIINLQAGRHTPYSREEVIADYISIGTYKRNYTKILLVIVARSAIKRQVDILNKAGLRLEKVFFAPEGIAWFIHKILKLETQDFPATVVHIDEGLTDFSIVFRDRAIFSRAIPIGAQNLIIEKDKYELRFGDEIKRSLEGYYNEDIEKAPNMLVLTGAVEELNYLRSDLEGVLNLPVKVMPYLKNLILSERASRVASTTKRLSFLSVIAPLLAWGELKVDLVPEEIKLRKAVEERGKELVKTGIYILTTLFLLFSIFISKAYFKGLYLKKLNTKYQSLSKEVEQLQSDLNKNLQIKNYLANRGYSLEVLSELYNIIPEDLELNDIKFDEQGKFSVRGIAESMSTVFSFVENMGKSQYFKDVRTKYTTKRKEESRDVTDFEIGCVLNKKVE